MTNKKATPVFDSEYESNTVAMSNGYNVMMPWAQSTGFRTHAVKHAKQYPHLNVAEEFIANSSIRYQAPESELSIATYLNDFHVKLVSLIDREDEEAFPSIPLPNGPALDLCLGDALTRRRSTRYYTGDPLDLAYLATLLRAGNGICANAEVALRNNKQANLHLRTAASAGGLYPIQIHVLATAVDKLSKGIYRYQPIQDRLLQLDNHQTHEKILRMFHRLTDLLKQAQPSAIFLLTMRPWRSMRKYGNVGLRFAFQELGAISQNIHLAATALGLGSLDCASFTAEDGHQILKMDGISHLIAHTIFIGHP